jgi:dienelactone hydrolase
MRTASQEQLITAIAEDGVELDGVLIGRNTDEPRPVVLWIHGFGANFYFAPYLSLARALAACGIAVAVVNTRGHDLATLLQPRARTPYWGGAAWEVLDESPRDLAGWMDAATHAGFTGVVLVGHSLGAVKVTHYLAERQDPRVLGLALAAPPLQQAWDTQAYPDALAEAHRLVRAGHPEALFAGPWGLVSGQTYLSLDRVGFDQFGRTTNEPNVARITSPIFVVIGAEDAQVCTANDLEVIRRNARAAPRVETHVIDGSDHFFTGHAADVANLLAAWIATLS